MKASTAIALEKRPHDLEPRSPTLTLAKRPAGLSKRIAQIDGLRGFLLLLMAFDHFTDLPNLAFVQEYTCEGIGYVTAAEAFFFISGFSVAWAYFPTLASQGRDALRSRVFSRIKKIYWGHLFICLAAAGFAIGRCLHEGDPLQVTRYLRAVCLQALLLFRPAHLDILPLYLVYMAIAPAVLFQLYRGRYRAVTFASVSTWLLFQFVHFPRHIGPFLFAGGFDLGAWQLLFVTGLIAGVLRRESERQGRGSILPDGLAARVFPGLCVATLAVFFAGKWGWLPFGEFTAGVVMRAPLAPIRVLTCIALFYLTALGLGRFQRLFTWRFLTFLGQNSLLVFAWHELVRAFLFESVSKTLSAWPVLAASAVVCASLLSLYVPPWLWNKWQNAGSIR